MQSFWDAHFVACLWYPQLNRIGARPSSTFLALAERLCCSFYKCMFLTNMAPFKREIKRFPSDLRFNVKKQCYNKEMIYQTFHFFTFCTWFCTSIVSHLYLNMCPLPFFTSVPFFSNFNCLKLFPKLSNLHSHLSFPPSCSSYPSYRSDTLCLITLHLFLLLDLTQTFPLFQDPFTTFSLCRLHLHPLPL